jgi:23S rRNA pseudouridine2457 synthase
MHSHYLIHKPYGYLSQFTNNGPKQGKKKLLGELYDFAEGTMAIGRLDEKSEGLLLLTTDGKKSELVRSKKVEKEYYAQIDGIIDDSALLKLREGVEIGFKGIRYLTKPCVVKSIPDPNFEARVHKIRDSKHGPTSWISVTLTEGKFRQVRKMTAAVGFPTLRLVRVRIGGHFLNNMKAGEVKEIQEYLLKN